MNKEFLEKALDRFDEWPFCEQEMIYCHDIHELGRFYGYTSDSRSRLNQAKFTYVCTREEFEQAKALKELAENATAHGLEMTKIHYTPNTNEQPVYTKEFVARGGKSIDKVWQPCEILFEGAKFIVVRDKHGREYSRRKAKIEIRDIDTRTAEQKCIDDLSGFMPHVNTPLGMYFEFDLFIEQVKDGKIHGLKWVDDE